MKVKLLKKLRKKARERIFIVEYCDALKERTGYDYVIHYPTFYGSGFISELREDSAYLICKVGEGISYWMRLILKGERR